MGEYMLFNTRVYGIRREKNNIYILAYAIYPSYPKRITFYTFQTEKEIPKILKKYENIKRENKKYYPKALIIPPPQDEINNKQPIPFNGFGLAIVYSKEIPYYVPLNNLIIPYVMTIHGKKGIPQEIYVEGISGIDALNGDEKPRYYIIHLEKARSLDDLIFFIRSRKSTTNYQSNEKNKMENIGWYIIIDRASDKQSELTPRDIKILEIYR
jgi:hypothetical protein